MCVNAVGVPSLGDSDINRKCSVVGMVVSPLTFGQPLDPASPSSLLFGIANYQPPRVIAANTARRLVGSRCTSNYYRNQIHRLAFVTPYPDYKQAAIGPRKCLTLLVYVTIMPYHLQLQCGGTAKYSGQGPTECRACLHGEQRWLYAPVPLT